MSDELSTERVSTGNEYVSIPRIAAASAGIEAVGFMHSGLRACIELHGSAEWPLLRPIVEIDGANLFDDGVQHELVSHWIPRFAATGSGIGAEAVIFAPLDRRGFVCVLTVENRTGSEVRFKAGWRGCWESSYHVASMSRPIAGATHAHVSSWRAGIPVLEFRGNVPLFAMALAPEEIMPARLWDADGTAQVTEWTGGGLSARSGSALNYELADEYKLGPCEKRTVPVYVGIGLEEVSSVASAHELRLHGWERMLSGLRSWLDAHTIECDDDYMGRLMNLNSFYNYFFSQAIALDTEELVVASARSSLNDSCGVYRGRDAMMWALPAVLQINWAQARKMLIYAFTRQLPNVGVHSRFIDGIVLEPGLQLDQLCAPIKALYSYVQLTNDLSVLFDRRVQTGINTIKQILSVQRHPDVSLFETLLLPSGDPSKYPYVCYSNVLAWRVLLDLARLYDIIRDVDRTDEAAALASKVKAAILEHFVVQGPFGEMFARGIDLEGDHELGDDPAGSLQMMTYYGFCSPDDPVYKNTVAWIHSEHNPNSGCGQPFAEPSACDGSGPSVLSVVNDLLTDRREEALDFLRRARLDDGIACESVGRETGKAMSGRDYASCAGYLAYGLRTALKAFVPEAATAGLQRRPSESLSQPPPEITQDSRKARL